MSAPRTCNGAGSRWIRGGIFLLVLLTLMSCSVTLGTEEDVSPALELGILELVPEYSGAALDYYTPGSLTGADAGDLPQQLDAALETAGLRALAFSRAQDRDKVAVTRATAERHDLESVSDLDRVAPELLFGGPPECPQRPTCLPGLERVYGLRFAGFISLDVGGPITSAALADGVVDAALLFTTDADVRVEDFVLLDDDRHLQPRQNIVPVVRPEVVQRFGSEAVDIIDAVSRRLTTRDLSLMDESAEQGRAPEQITLDWLERNGLIPQVESREEG
ncbi:MAG: ABC transporter substrate-binding protein [Actinomycetota bacterium]